MGKVKVLLLITLAQLSLCDNKPAIYSKANSDFTSDLFFNIVQGQEASNVLVSPASIQTCLAMAFFGSNGKTSDELITGLHFSTSNKSLIASKSEKTYETLSPLIKFANRIYVNKKFQIKPEYNELMNKSFKAIAENLDFEKSTESANLINQWVQQNTNEKIKNMIQATDVKNSNVIMINAVHFKAFWSQKFNNKTTKKAKFWMNNVDSVEVDMMSNLNKFKYGELEDLQAKVVELPYAKTDFSMLLILPNDKDGLKNLEGKLKTIDLMELALKLENSSVTVKIPKFEFEYEVKLNDILKNMGIKTLFTSEADFSNLLSSGNTYVSKVIHKTTIVVDEDGTEAAAATALASLGTNRIYPPFKKFIADHPFIFIIKDNVAIYFVGHVARF